MSNENPKETTKTIKLPNALTLEAAEKITGDKSEARKFYRAVANAGGFGDFKASEMLGGVLPALDLKGLREAAEDPKNANADVSRAALANVEAFFAKTGK